MIIKEKELIRNINGTKQVIGALYQKKHRVVLRIGDYKFKTKKYVSKKENADKFNEILSFANRDAFVEQTPDAPLVLYFRDTSCTLNLLRVVVNTDLTVQAHEIGWHNNSHSLKGSHTIKDLHRYYKEKNLTLH